MVQVNSMVQDHIGPLYNAMLPSIEVYIFADMLDMV
jgi:hypothetical protein